MWLNNDRYFHENIYSHKRWAFLVAVVQQYFKRFIVVAFVASATLNDSKWALRSKTTPNNTGKELPLTTLS